MNLGYKYKFNFTFLIIAIFVGFFFSCGKSQEEKKEQSKDVLINTILGLGYLEDNDTATIPDVPFGSFNFEATTTENSNVIASTSIEVTEIKEYSWVIK